MHRSNTPLRLHLMINNPYDRCLIGLSERQCSYLGINTTPVTTLSGSTYVPTPPTHVTPIQVTTSEPVIQSTQETPLTSAQVPEATPVPEATLVPDPEEL